MRVAIVDDHAPTLRALERFFSRHPVASRWTRSYAATPSAVLPSVLRGRLDVVVTDVRFGAGEMSGVDLLRAVRASGNPIPIVLYSAWDWTPEERAECLRAGATDVLHKPLDGIELLVARIESLDPELRRTSGVHRTSGTFTIGRLRIDATGAAVANGQELPLTPNSRALLMVLAAVFPRHATHADLLRAMGYESVGTLAEAHIPRKIRNDEPSRSRTSSAPVEI